jgi:hypothetical protein
MKVYGTGVKVGDGHKITTASFDNGERGDFAYVPGVGLACRSMVTDNLRELLSEEVEFLPLSVDGQAWHMLNVTKLVDCLDLTKTQLIPPNSLHPYDARNISFAEELTVGRLLFRVPQFRRSRTFATESFRSFVVSCGYTGVEFSLPVSNLDTIRKMAREGFVPPD